MDKIVLKQNTSNKIRPEFKKQHCGMDQDFFFLLREIAEFSNWVKWWAQGLNPCYTSRCVYTFQIIDLKLKLVPKVRGGRKEGKAELAQRS